MAEDYALETVAAERNAKFLKVFIVIAVLCFSGELIWLLGITPFRPLLRIDISGYDGLARDEILAKAEISKSASYFSVNAHAIEKSLMAFTGLESAKVLKSFPDRIHIVLEKREAVASVLANVGDKTVPLFFDSHGVIFRIGRGEESDSLPSPLPVVSGIVIEDPYPGMSLPAMFIPFFGALEKIRVSSPKLLEAISEIRINRKAFDSFDFVVYPVHKRISVRLSEINEDMLRYSLLMVDVLASANEGIESLDFRSGIASYIPKEASSE